MKHMIATEKIIKFYDMEIEFNFEIYYIQIINKGKQFKGWENEFRQLKVKIIIKYLNS